MAISVENRQLLPHPVYFAPRLKGFPLELGIGGWGQKLWWSYRAEQKVWRYLQLCGYNLPTWQTDGIRATAKTALTLCAYA